jgi:hypothetical protein
MSESSTKMPGERAPLLLNFGNHASRMAALIRERPILTARLIVAPREAIHAVGAFLHLAPDATGPDAEVAALIDNADPRDLLGAALPGCPARLFKALDRAGDRVREPKFYERLGIVSRGPFGDALLSGGNLDDGRLALFESFSDMDPLVISLRGALGEARYLVEGADCLLAFLRARGALDEREFRLPPKAGLPALVRRFQAALGRIPAPDPGFEPPPPYRLVSTTAELQRIGKAFRNCVALPNWHAAQHHFRLLDGSGVYLVADEPAMLVALRRVDGELWLLEQVAGPKNEAPPRGAQAALLRDLAAVGLKIVSADPQTAFSRLDGEARRQRHLPNRDDDDFDDDQDDGMDVAVEEVAA